MILQHGYVSKTAQNILQSHCRSHLHPMHKTVGVWFLKRIQHNYQTFRSSLVKITFPLRKAEKMTHYSYHSCCVWSKKQTSSVTPPRLVHCVEVVLETHGASWGKMTSAAKIKQYLSLMICGIEKHGLFLLQNGLMSGLLPWAGSRRKEVLKTCLQK